MDTENSDPIMRSGFGHLDETNRYVVEDHVRNPRRSDSLTDHNAEARIDNPFCGDEVFVQLRIAEGLIDSISVQGSGCAITQAASSMMGEVAEGRQIAEINELSGIVRQMLTKGELPRDREADEIGDMVALRDVSRFPVRVKCALLPWATLEDAIERYNA